MRKTHCTTNVLVYSFRNSDIMVSSRDRTGAGDQSVGTEKCVERFQNMIKKYETQSNAT